MFSVEKVLQMRRDGFTWNEIDVALLPPNEIFRRNGKIVSKAFKWAKANNVEGAFSKAVIGAYTATQIVVPIRKFDHLPAEIAKEFREVMKMS